MAKNNYTILNTRPKSQQLETEEAFRVHGFGVINFPCIEIVVIKNQSMIASRLDSCGLNDVVIFTSQHAVSYAFKVNPQWNLKDCNAIIAVGLKTAQTYEQNDSGHIWIPQQQDSQGVIELLQGFKNFKAIKLITAQHGRDVIQKFAQDNQIELEQINVYERQLPVLKSNNLKLIQEAKNLSVLATSVVTLQNLQELVPEHLWNKLLKAKVLCTSSRIEGAADTLGFINTINMKTANPGKMAIKLLA